MSNSLDSYDAIIIGGGFYGCAIAHHLESNHSLKKICLIEKESNIFARASLNNQYRVHNGYHYPRSFRTANRSRVNFQRFIKDWPSSIISNFDSLYAIPKQNSKINSLQFENFSRSIGARLSPAESKHTKLFNDYYFESIYKAQEFCFDPVVLKNLYISKLNKSNIKLMLNSKVLSILKKNSSYEVLIDNQSLIKKKITSSLIFNCTYSGLNQIGGDLYGPRNSLKHEIAELVYFSCPKELLDVGITVMDGPFFSILPTDRKNILSLSHVRYTPHKSWKDKKNINPYAILDQYEKHSVNSRMFRAAQKWIPSITENLYINSRFEIKTILDRNEIDDGRPILFERDQNLHNVFYILGSKIDNIYDALEKIDEELKK